jgi:hypothetical protein
LLPFPGQACDVGAPTKLQSATAIKKLPSARWRDIVLTSQESAPKRNIINYHTDENRATLAWLQQKIL